MIIMFVEFYVFSTDKKVQTRVTGDVRRSKVLKFLTSKETGDFRLFLVLFIVGETLGVALSGLQI